MRSSLSLKRPAMFLHFSTMLSNRPSLGGINNVLDPIIHIYSAYNINMVSPVKLLIA